MDKLLVVNKEKNLTSRDIVNNLTKIFNTKKIGHTGTLDPIATGVLVCLFGKYTKLVDLLTSLDKEYIAEIKLGIKTSTADVEGDIIEEKDVDDNIFNKEYLSEKLNCFVGNLVQIPPIYSAIKVKGKKLYEYARNNIEVDIPKRNIEIYSIKLIDFCKKDKTIVFEVECSKGTYIRSLCEDIAEKLGTIGYMKELRRTRVGEFNINEAVTIDDIENNKDNENWIKNKVISLEKLLKENGCINLDKELVQKFFNGVKLKYNGPDGIYKIYFNNEFLGTGVVKEKSLKRDIIVISEKY